eukprot:CAMPEP_0197074536 /NCGR_PEP_ID=MMETSP1384-20130603/211160_1 /TAXON_ID=29189 /ORGANISM="Ammonia sp." /LENGTH=156 /DNA_ID=CAMNT_0042513377 /DNA_START=29 /DNA_END=499 /DNA_ORIENTATION=+
MASALWNESEPNFQCNEFYLNDGYCEDMCQTEECGFDEYDCGLQCRQDWCSEIYSVWINSGGAANYISYPDLCDELYLSVEDDVIEELGVGDPVYCQFLTGIADLNRDGFINFKEWVFLVQTLMTQFMLEIDLNIALAMNCSSCVGVEEYNAVYSE